MGWREELIMIHGFDRHIAYVASTTHPQPYPLATDPKPHCNTPERPPLFPPTSLKPQPPHAIYSQNITLLTNLLRVLPLAAYHAQIPGSVLTCAHNNLSLDGCGHCPCTYFHVRGPASHSQPTGVQHRRAGLWYPRAVSCGPRKRSA